MIATIYSTRTYEENNFSYDNACQTAQRVMVSNNDRIARINFEGVTATTTSALARLILLRRHLLESGRDLRIVGLDGRAKALYEVNKLQGVLPQ